MWRIKFGMDDPSCMCKTDGDACNTVTYRLTHKQRTHHHFPAQTAMRVDHTSPAISRSRDSSRPDALISRACTGKPGKINAHQQVQTSHSTSPSTYTLPFLSSRMSCFFAGAAGRPGSTNKSLMDSLYTCAVEAKGRRGAKSRRDQ